MVRRNWQLLGTYERRMKVRKSWHGKSDDETGLRGILDLNFQDSETDVERALYSI